MAPFLMRHVRVIDYDPLLDSCNMSHFHWQVRLYNQDIQNIRNAYDLLHRLPIYIVSYSTKKIAGDIRDHYDQFDSFVVVHGTDTMAYTARLPA